MPRRIDSGGAAGRQVAGRGRGADEHGGEPRHHPVINVFSFDDFTGFDGFIPTVPATNPNFGRPNNLIDPGRRLQLGVRYQY